MATLAGLVLLTAGLGGVSPGLTAGPAPPLPPQPNVTPGNPGCPASRARGGVLFAEQTESLSVRVDRGGRCVFYRAHDGQTIERTLDGGRSWQTVFHDAVSACDAVSTSCPVGRFSASGLETPQAGILLMPESGNGDAMVQGTGYGGRWTLANSGLAGQPVISVTSAPSDPRVLYAIVSSTGAASPATPAPPPVPPLPGVLPPPPVPPPQGPPPDVADSATLWISRDGGAAWSQVSGTPPHPFPYTDVHHPPFVAVDPLSPTHLWVVTPGAAQHAGEGQGLLYEIDLAASTATQTILPSNGDLLPGGLSILASSSHIRRFVLREVPASTPSTPLASSVAPGLLVSDDGGLNWAYSSLPPDHGGAGFAFDPTNPNRALYAGLVVDQGATHLRLAYTEDGFVTSATVRAASDGLPFVTPAGPWPEGGVLQSDAGGQFYLHGAFTCGAALPAPCNPAAGSPLHLVLRVDPVFTSVPTGGGGGGLGGTYRGPLLPLSELRTCTLPASAPDFNSLGFDGRDLLYTGRGVSPIHRVDARSCRDSGDVQAQLSPADAARVQSCKDSAGSGQSGRPGDVQEDDLAYDLKRQRLWFDMGFALAHPGSCLASIPLPVGRPREPILGTAPWLNGCGQGFLAYDEFEDSFWTCDRNGTVSSPDLVYQPTLNHISAADGRSLAPCPGRSALPQPPPPGSDGVLDEAASTWAVGGPHRLYVQMENDQVIREVDTVSCVVLEAYIHRQYSEANAEEDQMVCDPVTFGPTNAPAVWMRDQGPGTVTAYSLTDGYCPLLTATKLLSADTTATGACARVVVRGREFTLPGLPVSFLAEDGTVLGGGSTDAAGTACSGLGSLPAGRHTLTALFSGLRGLFGSSDSGTVDIQAPPGPPPPQPAPPPLPPLPAEPPPPPLPAHPPMQALQAPAQTQMQPVTQGQAQAQPAAATVQEEEQEMQVAVAAEGAARQDLAIADGWEMTALAPPEPAAVQAGLSLGGGLLLALLLGLGVRDVAREQVAPATARRRPRRPGG